jgi:hypothetical protein
MSFARTRRFSVSNGWCRENYTPRLEKRVFYHGAAWRIDNGRSPRPENSAPLDVEIDELTPEQVHLPALVAAGHLSTGLVELERMEDPRRDPGSKFRAVPTGRR